MSDSFQGVGFMVEPFSRPAFALKPFEMSAPVKTQFGYHLILVTDRKPGRDVKFEEVEGDGQGSLLHRPARCDRHPVAAGSQHPGRSGAVSKRQQPPHVVLGAVDKSRR